MHILQGDDCSKPTSDLIGAVTESINGREYNEESLVQCTTEKEEGELSPYGDYEDHNLQGHAEAGHEPEDSSTSMQYQTGDSEDDEIENDIDDDDKGDIHLNLSKPLIVHVPLLLQDKEKERATQIFYGNDSFYVLFRLYQVSSLHFRISN